MAQRTVYNLEANSEEFATAARAWYRENDIRFAFDEAFTGTPAIDAAHNPGWYYNLALKTALRTQTARQTYRKMANYAYYNFAPTVGISFGLGFAVDLLHDWST